MKKIYAAVAMVLCCYVSNAQYKKATFLSKQGRTYEIGTAQHFMSSGSARTGFYLSYGRDKGTAMFYWIDAEVVLPGTFHYTTTDEYSSGTNVAVSGKTKLAFLYRYNFAYYLLKGEGSETKLKPFVNAGLSFAFAKGDESTYQYSPNITPAKGISDDGFSYGINAGAGTVYNISETFGLKLMAGYNYQLKNPTFDAVRPFEVYTNHVYATLGVRFTLSGDND